MKVYKKTQTTPKMDTIYGTKKYLQSLSAGSDIYRSSACRPLHNHISYQATLGRGPVFETYHHANSQTTGCIKNYSRNNAYNYNSWSVGCETKNLAPSIYTTSKSRLHQHKSFSILLTTAAFILLLAVLTVAALAYYISSIKMKMDDSMLAFEGSFQIAKGDMFTTGLKYNHTTTYKQKVEFYKRFLERALNDNGLLPLHTEVWGFGDGPLLKVSFKIILDVRKWPQNGVGVEQFIKESIFLETVADKSLYRYLRIDPDSVDVKRTVRDNTIKADVTNAAAQSEKRYKKVNKNALNLVSKPDSTTTKLIRTTPHSIAESDYLNAEIEKAPVVHGSFEGAFEITKTDADITQTKVMPTKAYSSSLAPKAVTPYFIRVRPKKPAIEKLTTKTVQEQTNLRAQAATQQSSTTPNPIVTKIVTTSTPIVSTTTSTTTMEPTTRKITTTTSSEKPSTTRESYISTKLFANHAEFQPAENQVTTKAPLQTFTSFPILDTQPWRPIHRDELLPGLPPAFPTKTIYLTKSTLPPATESYFNMFAKSKNQINPIYSYNTFGNMSYHNIEHLGSGSQIKPHPLPVSLIDEVVPTFKPIHSKTTEETQTASGIIDITTMNGKDTMLEKTAELEIQNSAEDNDTIVTLIVAEPTTTKSTTTTSTTTTTTSIKPITFNVTNKPLFWNMKEEILKRNQFKNETNTTSTMTNNKKKPIITLDDSYLFPSHSKWQLLNSSSSKNNLGSMTNLRRVFNKTLHALVSEDIKKNAENETLNEIKTRINNVTNLQDISHIFDTLASKLGVTATPAAKLPPVSQHRLKQTIENDTHIKQSLTSKKPYFTTISSLMAQYLQEQEDTFSKSAIQATDLANSSASEGVGAAIPVFGEAEVEDMDPTKYEELLKSTQFSETSSRETLTELVTLLPARSNSAIRRQPTYADVN